MCRTLLSKDDLQQTIVTDGELAPAEVTLDLAEQLRLGGPWGQAFPEPCFRGEFRIVQQRIVGERHLKLVLQRLDSGQALDAIWFGIDTNVWPDPARERVHCAYQLDVNEFRGQRSLQLRILHME